MTKSECYNYDWFLDWLKRSIVPTLIPQLTLSAEHIAKNFTRLYFDVDEELVALAFQELGYDCKYINGEKRYSISLTDKAKAEFETNWK